MQTSENSLNSVGVFQFYVASNQALYQPADFLDNPMGSWWMPLATCLSLSWGLAAGFRPLEQRRSAEDSLESGYTS
jgi:hypothetical protein